MGAPRFGFFLKETEVAYVLEEYDMQVLISSLTYAVQCCLPDLHSSMSAVSEKRVSKKHQKTQLVKGNMFPKPVFSLLGFSLWPVANCSSSFLDHIWLTSSVRGSPRSALTLQDLISHGMWISDFLLKDDEWKLFFWNVLHLPKRFLLNLMWRNDHSSDSFGSNKMSFQKFFLQSHDLHGLLVLAYFLLCSFVYFSKHEHRCFSSRTRFRGSDVPRFGRAREERTHRVAWAVAVGVGVASVEVGVE